LDKDTSHFENGKYLLNTSRSPSRTTSPKKETKAAPTIKGERSKKHITITLAVESCEESGHAVEMTNPRKPIPMTETPLANTVDGK